MEANNLRQFFIKQSLLIFLSLLVGILGGITGNGLAHLTIWANQTRINHPQILLLLPVGGIIVTLLYKYFKLSTDIGPDYIVKAINTNDTKIPFKLYPLIFVSTGFSHFCGASVGRVGATVQLGGSLGELLSKTFKLDTKTRQIIIIVSIAAVFSALFGTPAACAVFASELTLIDGLYLKTLPYTLISSYTARFVCSSLGLANTKYTVTDFPEAIQLNSIFFVCLTAALVGICAVIYCYSIQTLKSKIESGIKNFYIRGAFLGIVLLILTYALKDQGFQDFNGIGNYVIARTFDGNVLLYAFAVKIIFTLISFSAGYKGGEVYPAVFIGATLGCSIGTILNFSPAFCSGLGIGAMFCGVTKCPLASIVLCMELFGHKGFVYYIIAVAVSLVFSKKATLYPSQKKMFLAKTFP